MSLIKSSNKRSRTTGTTEREPTPYDHLWLNLGVYIKSPTEDNPDASKFVRLPRGVAVSDLQTKKVYANMSDEFTAEVTLMNQIIELIREKGMQLKAGESADIALEVQVYARQEDIAVAPVTDNSDLAAQLFGERQIADETTTQAPAEVEG